MISPITTPQLHNSSTINHPTIIAIIGAGAAGCFAAANIPFSKDRKVILLEKGSKPLQKVKVSGGGRCNVTHALFDQPAFAKHYPRGEKTLRKSLHHFSAEDTIDWFAQRGVTLKAEGDGRMFPTTDNSQTVIDCLLQELEKNQVDIRYQKNVQRMEQAGSGFIIHFADGAPLPCDQILVAAGGFPKALQFGWLTALGHSLKPPVPSLFTFNLPKHPITQLMGLSVPLATVKIAGTKIETQGPLLITHWGLSGPAILKASAWGARELSDKNYQFTALVNWVSEKEAVLRERFQSMRENAGKKTVHNSNEFGLPKRLWHFLLESCGIAESVKWAELSGTAQNKLIQTLTRQEFHVSGKTTFKEEFVTCGGIPLSEINHATMESKLVPGLFFAGEVCDVDGITGGFNFQWAWCSGWLAAKGMV